MRADDTLILGEIGFSEKEEKNLKFNAKPKKQLSVSNQLSFNGSIFNLKEDFSADLQQNGQGNKIELVDAKDTSLDHSSKVNHDLVQKDYVQ